MQHNVFGLGHMSVFLFLTGPSEERVNLWFLGLIWPKCIKDKKLMLTKWFHVLSEVHLFLFYKNQP